MVYGLHDCLATITLYPHYIGDCGEYRWSLRRAVVVQSTCGLGQKWMIKRPLNATKHDCYNRRSVVRKTFLLTWFSSMPLMIFAYMNWTVPALYVGRAEDLLGRVPLFPCFLDGNTSSTIPHKYAARQKQAFEFGCANGHGQASRRGSYVYEINTWLWNFGRPQARVAGLSVAKTERIGRQSRSDTSRRAWETRQARKPERAAEEIWQV